MASTRKPFLRLPLQICHSYFSTHSQLPFSLMWHATTTCHAGTHTPCRHLHKKFWLCPCLQLHSTTDMWDPHVRVIFNLKHPPWSVPSIPWSAASPSPVASAPSPGLSLATGGCRDRHVARAGTAWCGRAPRPALGADEHHARRVVQASAPIGTWCGRAPRPARGAGEHCRNSRGRRPPRRAAAASHARRP
jgi:hypothetical protein